MKDQAWKAGNDNVEKNYRTIELLIHLKIKYLLRSSLAPVSILHCFLLLFLTGFVQNGALASVKDPADKIFFGGDFITVDDSNPHVQALSVRDGRIQALGTEEQMRQLAGPETRVIDLQGNTLMPGLIDAHTHPILSALMGQVIDVSGFSNNNSAQVMASLKAGIKQLSSGEGEWILAYGWDPAIHRDLKAPTMAELDRLAPNNPLFIITQTLHTAFANSSAFAAAGITKNSPNPQGGYFQKDAEGELTGTVIEVAAIAQFRKHFPKFPEPVYLYLLTEQLDRYAQSGYTTIVAPGLQPLILDHIRLFQVVSEYQDAPVRSHTYPLYEFMYDSPYTPGSGTEQFKVMGVKLWIDGSPYAGGMAMYEPYLDTQLTRDGLGIPVGGKGHLGFSDDALLATVEKFHRLGWQVAAHVQGERAVDQFLDAIETAQEKFPRDDTRHRMEHLALVTEKQLQRAISLGVTTSFYIEHVSYYGDALQEAIVGPQRAARFMPMSTARKNGHRVSLHTDSPSSPLNVFHAMQTAVSRVTQSGKYTLGPQERLTVDEAIKAVTIDAAWQIFEEQSRGSLEVGKLADFTVVSKNMQKIPPEQWTDITVVDTYLGGDRVVTKAWSVRKITLLIDAAWEMAKGWFAREQE